MKPEHAVRLDRVAGRWVYPLHRAVYRLTGGAVGGTFEGRPMLLLTTTGRRTGEPRTCPLLYYPSGHDLVVVASNGGRPAHPAWLHNLRAREQVQVQVGRRRRPAVARVVDAAERARWWPELIRFYAGWAHYETITDRPLEVVVITPRG